MSRLSIFTAVAAASIAIYPVALLPQSASMLKTFPFYGSHYILDKELVQDKYGDDVNMFEYPKDCAIVYVSESTFLAFIIDPAWNRLIYGEWTNEWVKPYGWYGYTADGTGWNHPRRVVTDGLGNVYVADTYNGRVVSLEYDATEEEIDPGSFTSLGASVLELPWDVDVDDRGDTSVSNDHLWVIDKSLNRVLKFNLSGQHLLSITSLHNPSTSATYSDLSGLSGVAVRKSAANGNNSTSNYRLYLIDWKQRKLFLVGADNVSGGQATIYRETDTFPDNYVLTDIESDFFGDVWIVNETGNAIEKYTWDLKYLDSQSGLNRPTSVASSRRHDRYMAITERWTETTGSRIYTHGAHINDLYINPGKTMTYFNFKTTNYGRVAAKVYQGTTLISHYYVGFDDYIRPSGQQSGYVYQQSPEEEYTLKVFAYVYNDTSKYHVVEQNFQFLPEWPANLTLSDMTIWGEQWYTVTNSITAGPNFTVEDGADVHMRAKNTITLVPGFTAKAGSEFNAYIYTGSIPKAIPADTLVASAPDSGRNDTELTPRKYTLSHNYPNPFNPITTIRFGLPEPAHTRLVVYDLLGRQVIRLVDQHLEPGYHAVVWNGRIAAGREVPSGIYIARIVTPKYVKSIKMLLLK
ncbi:MAG: T9SS type A sorting domain-containing protein [Fidelibacterota bacterium]|nr:MAG: T9SS type A sorting domain-containing protein [Candidatus Neomarinimicrobiota bacterium]